MKPYRGVPRAMLRVLVVLAGTACTQQLTDREARKFYREELSVFLDSLVYQTCELKYDPRSNAADAPGQLLCPGKGLPSPKAPTWALLASASGMSTEPGGDKDSEARKYIRDDLQPWIDSVVYNLCHVKVAVAPNAPGQFICGPYPDGYKKPPSNGAP